MIDHCENARRSWIQLAALFILLATFPTAVANEAGGLRVTDYFVSHRSNEPFYAQQNLAPDVLLHVREVVLAGRERTVAKDGKVLLLIHGASIPGYVAFDTDHANCSLMRNLADAGWDTFALDLEGFGLSTRPMLMDNPAAFPDSKAPMHVEVTITDVERVVEFIGTLRGTEKINLLGWSQGASLEAPLYTIRHPEKIARLVLFGVAYDLPASMDERKKRAAEREAKKVVSSEPLLKDWRGLGTREEWVIPGCFEAYRRAHLASDPRSNELGGVVRLPTGRFVDQGLTKPLFDASKIAVPTLIIRGDADTYATHDDNQRLVNALGSTAVFVEIPNAGHFLPFEQANGQFYESVKKFLDAKE